MKDPVIMKYKPFQDFNDFFKTFMPSITASFVSLATYKRQAAVLVHVKVV